MFALAGPACGRCRARRRLIVDGDLVLARCVGCRELRVFAAQGSPWAALATPA